MGIFDFLFGNKKKELERQEQLVREEDRKRKLDEQLKQLERQEELVREEDRQCKLGEHFKNNDNKNDNLEKIIQRPNTNMLPIDEDISNRLENLATNVNFSLNIGNQQATVVFMNELFNFCYGRNGYKLLQLSDDGTQVVGLAFTSIARYLDFNDKDLNSVASENAVYCLGRSLIVDNNVYCAPAIFSLLLHHTSLLKDKLIASHAEISQKEVGMPIGIMLGGNPFNAPHLNDFREQAVFKRIPIMTYLLTLFYDEKNKKYLIPTDMPYHIPGQNELNDFIMMREKCDDSYDEIIKEGEEYFYQLFEECQKTLYSTKYLKV